MKIGALSTVVLILVLFSFTATADDYISDPSNIPDFENFITPQIETGESGTFRFTVENRYEDVIENITLTVSIYGCGTSYFYENIENVEHPPTINGEGTEHVFPISFIENGTLAHINFTINTSPDTTQGTYFVRFQLGFEYNNTPYIMKSKGYFTDQQWDNATSNADRNDPGKIDIEILDVDGIIPDSTFKVKDPIPIWPLYVCFIPILVVLGVLAILFFCQEEYNMFPWLDQGSKYWSGKFHQFWRLLKHRFR